MSITPRKLKIAKEWEHITFTKMKGLNERSEEELERVLKFQKSITPKGRY